MQPGDDLGKQIDRQARRIKKAAAERPTLMAQTVYIGTLNTSVLRVSEIFREPS